MEYATNQTNAYAYGASLAQAEVVSQSASHNDRLGIVLGRLVALANDTEALSNKLLGPQPCEANTADKEPMPASMQRYIERLETTTYRAERTLEHILSRI